MDQKWIPVLVIVAFYQIVTSGALQETIVREGQNADITCNPKEKGSISIWFRVLDKSGMEFIASYGQNGLKKTQTTPPSSSFSEAKILSNTLVLKSFKKDKDSGIYSCASLYQGKELKFGEVTRLVGEEVKPVTTTKPVTSPSTTAPACVCNTKTSEGSTDPSLTCTPLILGPLAGGCGLLLLLLIVTVLYCNKIRTNRCPHHYKRKPRPMPPGKQMQMHTNRHM